MALAPLGFPDHASEHHAPAERTWYPLRLFGLYRLVLASLFLAVTLVDAPSGPPLGQALPQLFRWTAVAYLVFAGLASMAGELRRPPFAIQLHVQTLGDIAFLTVLMHASGGAGSGIGMLLVVTVAISAMITAGRTAGLFAAVASIAVLLEQLYTQVHLPGTAVSYPQAGMLGATLFATAVLAHVLARRARVSEALAVQREVDLANMAQMAEYIIQHMRTGIVVVDRFHRVRLMNAAAAQLLHAGDGPNQPRLGELSPDLNTRMVDWLQHHGRNPQPLQLADVEHEVLPRFMGIGTDGAAGTLVFLEDASQAARQVQQLKLAALGRLTASIAHEIRNPLGAISHAGQLLAETPSLERTDRRMVEIILENSQRVNTIIESVLQLGRRDRSLATTLELRTWLERFTGDFRRDRGLAEDELALEAATPLEVVIDPTHLEQILANLCDNAERHSRESPVRPRMAITTGRGRTGRPYLEVLDHGPGIPEEARAHVFEPFFTTRGDGTGLGLYISRELAECNRAELSLMPAEGSGCRFRLSFSEPSPPIN